jgi:non-specific serine/threonine protein kinase
LPEGRRWLQVALAQPSSADELLRARALTTDGALACLLGDFATGEAAPRAAASLAQAAADPIVEARARWIVAANRLSAGQPEGIMRELDRALTLFAQATTSTDRSRIAFTRATRATLAIMLGEVEQGIADFEQALAEVREAGSDGVTIVILIHFGWQLIALGETAQARGLFEEALALVVDYPGFHLTGLPLFGLAMIAAREGTTATAARRLGAAEELRIRNGVVIPAFMRDQIDRATALAKEALGAEPFAVAWDAGRANPEVVIADALGEREASAAATGESRDAAARGLTARERDVLRLLVAGDTDKEIAAALGISRRTVAFHVAAIRAKLDAPSRTAAATIAVRNGLV